jgi:hypothetical protein
MGIVSNTSILAADGQATNYPATVYWMAVSAAGTAGRLQLNDSTDDSGTDLFDVDVPADSMTFFGNLDLTFNTAVYVDIPGSNIRITVGHS